MTDSATAASAGALLRRLGFVARIQRVRSVLANAWEPWIGAGMPPGVPAPLPAGSTAESVAGLPHGGPALEAAFELLHLGRPVRADRLDTGEARLLRDAGLCVADGRDLVPGAWQLTAFGGLLAAADSEYGTGHADVHLGEDSLRFTAAILEAAPRGSVIDVGSGSGISAAAAARTADRVFALDILERARDAGLLTAGLNGAAGRVTAEVADFRDTAAAEHAGTVVANLPGVPVPSGMPYPAAGDGGPDGLALIRTFWEWFGDQGTADTLVMRFQSLGAPDAPAALAELAERFGTGHEVRVVTDSAVPVLVRDAITAERVAALAGRPADEVLAEISADRASAGLSRFHCSVLLVTRGKTAGVHHSRTGADLDLTRRRRGTGDEADPTGTALTYARRLRLMPDEFWSVDGEIHAAHVLRRLPGLVKALGEEATPEEAAADILLGTQYPHRPTERAGSALAVALLAHTLAGAGVLEPVTGPG